MHFSIMVRIEEEHWPRASQS